jgi:hypothetical protein
MKTAKIVFIVGLVTILVVLLVGAITANQAQVTDLVVEWVESNVDSHPTINDFVETIPSDCMLCHSSYDGEWPPSPEEVERILSSGK